jgi:S-formylglutathione hydrolase FrmB
MALTSDAVVALLSVLAVATLVAAVLLWPRVADRRVAHAAARAALIFATQVTAILALLGGLNAYFSFVVSWSDLIGSAAAIVPAGRGGHLPDVPPAPVVVTATQVAHTATGGGASASGEILTVRVRGERTGIVVPRSYVYLPPQYFQPAYAHRLFPAVLVLTGYPSDPRAEITRLALPSTAAAEVEAGRLRPTVFIMMFSSVDMPRDTECTDIPDGPQAATFFATDVPFAMQRSFRVATGRDSWAVMGDSTGGYCALKLAMMHSDRFAAAISLSGYYTAVRDFTTGNLYGRSAAYQSENDLFWRLRHRPPPPVSVLLATSRVGERDYPATLQFLGLIRPPMRGYRLIVPVGGHNFRTWKRELAPAFDWLNARLASASASGVAGSH